MFSFPPRRPRPAPSQSTFVSVPSHCRRPLRQIQTQLCARHAATPASSLPRAASCAATHSGPLASLDNGTWFKLICGASSHDVPAIRNTALVYTLAGVDCIDVACDAAVLAAAHEGMNRALELTSESSLSIPLLMVSISDGADPHFRKAEFPSPDCPIDCPRPCERVCPAAAIASTGVIADKCYGCGRCVPACPLGIISTYDVVHSRDSVCALLRNPVVDAIEIHTCQENVKQFSALWADIEAVVMRNVQIVAVSFPDPGSDAQLKTYLSTVWNLIRSGWEDVWDSTRRIRLIWQCDGLPMSGDVGRGTAKKSVRLAGRVFEALNTLGIPGDVQPAGGTNEATVPLLLREGLAGSVAGVAMGGYARKVIRNELEELSALGSLRLEENAEIFARAQLRARDVVSPLKAINR